MRTARNFGWSNSKLLGSKKVSRWSRSFSVLFRGNYRCEIGYCLFVTAVRHYRAKRSSRQAATLAINPYRNPSNPRCAPLVI